MNVRLYKIKCLTNLHVGNGDVNFNVIDREVERDPITNYPTINASGIKGGLREHFESFLGKDNFVIKDIFGTANDATKNNCSGKVKFLCANMLALPMRVSQGSVPYVLVTTITAINQLKSLCNAVYPHEIKESKKTIPIEIEGVLCDEMIEIFNENLYIMPEDSFRNISLPVAARNCIEENRENLWFEEIVPHESVFYFFTMSQDNAVDTFYEYLQASNIVQFGGNASIGYGVCKLEEV